MIAMHRQKGVAIVEHALTVAVFLMIVMAIIEFSLMIFFWARAAEASREAVRTAIVSDPVLDISAMDCPNGTVTELQTGCFNSAPCNRIVDRVARFIPDIAASNIEITYRCSNAGFSERPRELLIPEVTVKLTNLQYRLIVPGLLGLPEVWALPEMTSTRTGEDMETVPASQF